MSVINFIPLAVGSHANFATNSRISPRTYLQFHQWLGIIAILEGLLHSIALAFSGWVGVSPVVGGITLVVIFITSRVSVQRRFYEVFLKAHVLLAFILVSAIFYHVRPTVVYALSPILAWLVMRLMRAANILHRQIRAGAHGHEATILDLGGAFLVCVKLSRPWDFQPGQYVYLTLPNLSRSSQLHTRSRWSLVERFTEPLQSHPFMIAWWHRSRDDCSQGGYQQPDTVVLIVEKCKGFSEKLARGSAGDIVNVKERLQIHTWSKERSTEESPAPEPVAAGFPDITCWCSQVESTSGQIAIIEGPYGRSLDLGMYDRVLLFATGVGVAAQIPYLKKMLEDFPERRRPQRIALYWETIDSNQVGWALDWISRLLAMDERDHLLIQIFLKDGSSSQDGKKLKCITRTFDEKMVAEEIQSHSGPCVREDVGDMIQKVILQSLRPDIHFRELSFRPST
ncbi:uncharacterized protein TRUGW13939_08806 [Talaromyces rugulosus]|uniref:FAD-binding FR-type domain-containing protein n=1 Tax=Talaromyces rugulosus TaxID=121627 RepID=A0A7H8R5J1_TALRU|nr:uncharacterized protein TRUGW13939_08806 [Talaromyces rugulosus]QKX61654.1 hypothetical protein TRUGW13939_08806 [Talaromyces rugulosus]